MPDDYEFLKAQHDRMAANDLRKKIAEWAESPDAEEIFREIAIAIKADERLMERARGDLYMIMQHRVSV